MKVKTIEPGSLLVLEVIYQGEKYEALIYQNDFNSEIYFILLDNKVFKLDCDSLVTKEDLKIAIEDYIDDEYVVIVEWGNGYYKGFNIV